MALIKAEDLAVGYETGPVAEHIAFEVEPGDFLCIVGENGSGKSTLMKTLLGFQAPLSGRIVKEAGSGRGGIGYLPQQTDVQKDFPASVWEVVLSGCKGRSGWRPFYSKEEKALAQKNMDRMGIGTFARRCYRELSGGQQQRVLLARALCAADHMLLLDEPVTGLDPRVTQEMYDLIQRLNEEGVTILMISHDMDAAIRYASHILHIGDHIYFGRKEDYLLSSEGRAFLGKGGEEA